MNPIAVQSALLPDGTLDEKLAAAKAAGAGGVEFQADSVFYASLSEVIDGLDRHGLRASALRVGHTRLVHPEYAERERAMIGIQDALTAAVDIGGSGVVFYAHYAPHHVLPDLEPYRAAVELEAELLITLLRKTICDFANALNMRLLLAHADSGTTALLRRPEHAAMIRAKLDNHPILYVATSLAHLDAEGLGMDTLATEGIGYIGASDTNGALPGQARRDWRAFAAMLRTTGYDGWVTIEGRTPQKSDALRMAVQTLRDAGV